MKEITSLEIFYLIKELQSLVGVLIDKIYHKDRELRIRLFVPRRGSAELVVLPFVMHLTKHGRDMKVPTHFAMLLRKYLKDEFITNISQHGFDRIIEIHTRNNILILELFHKGNYILTDKDYNIIMPMEIQRWKQRKIIPKEKYVFPENPDIREFDILKDSLKRSDKRIVVFMVENGFGKYAQEVIDISGIDKDKPCKELDEKEVLSLFDAIKMLLEKETKPQIVKKDGKNVDAVPFDMGMYQELEKEYAESFNQALDLFFSSVEKPPEKEKNRYDRIIQQQKTSIEKMMKRELEKRNQAELVYKYYIPIKKILDFVKLQKNKTEDELVEEIKKMPGSDIFEKIHRKKIVFKINGREIEIDITKSIEKNVGSFYEKAKLLKKKRERAKEHMKKMKQTLEKKKESIKIKEEQKPKKWYHKYRHFITPNNVLVVAGKDARTNETLIRKHVGDKDVVFHADIHGAPFTVVKGNFDEEDLKQAAIFAASYSKAWAIGLGSVDVYYVKKDQLQKVPGLPTGAFQIRGKRTYIKSVKLELAVGVVKNDVIVAPVGVVEKMTKHFVVIQPGETRAHELAKMIKKRLLTEFSKKQAKQLMQTIENKIPSRKGMIVD
jgi:predicted ribosome quality control (RQC) complex YloA/Tae2 family protein